MMNRVIAEGGQAFPENDKGLEAPGWNPGA